MSKHIVKQIIETLGVDAICSAVNVTPHAVRYAKTDGVFPAAWYQAVSDMCKEHTLDCPMSAFNWKAPSPAVADRVQQ